MNILKKLALLSAVMLMTFGYAEVVKADVIIEIVKRDRGWFGYDFVSKKSETLPNGQTGWRIKCKNGGTISCDATVAPVDDSFDATDASICNSLISAAESNYTSGSTSGTITSSAYVDGETRTYTCSWSMTYVSETDSYEGTITVDRSVS